MLKVIIKRNMLRYLMVKYRFSNGLYTSSLLSFFQRVFKMFDLKKDGHIDFSEFVQYVMEHERKLQISFEELDRNKDGDND